MEIPLITRLRLRSAKSARSYTSTTEITDQTSKICKIMITCPKLGLETELDFSRVQISAVIVESVLQRFENAGMLAYQFFQWAEKQRSYTHSVRAYHSMIESLAKIRQYNIMWNLVNTMRNKNLLNVETFCIIMRRYARAKKIDEAIYAFNLMEKYEVRPNLAAFNGLLSALAKSRNVRKAQEFFDEMKWRRFDPDAKSYSVLMEGWGRAGKIEKSREVFREMVREGIEPDEVTEGIMVDVLCKGGRVEEAMEMVRGMGRPSGFIYSVLIHTLGEENRIGEAVEVFLAMERRVARGDVTAGYNALIGGFCKAGMFGEAYGVLRKMEERGVKANARSWNGIICSLIGRGERDEAWKAFSRMVAVCEPDGDTYTMMMKMWCENGDIDLAIEVWEYMKRKEFVPSMHTFLVLINGLCRKSMVDEICSLLEDMIEKGIRPSGPTVGRVRYMLLREGKQDMLNMLQHKVDSLVKHPLWD